MSWLGQIVALNMFFAAFSSSISHWGHLGGALGGGLAMYLFGPRYVWGQGRVENRPIIPLFRDMP